MADEEDDDNGHEYDGQPELLPLSVDAAAKVAGLFLCSRRVGAEFKRRCLFAVVPPDEQVGLEKIQKKRD